MSDELTLQQEEVRRIFDLQEKATADFRAGLAERSEGKVKYDEYLLSHLRKGKDFKIALRKANQNFPAQALNPSRDEMAETEAHYRLFLQMEGLDEKRREVEKHLGLLQQTERKIAEIDQKIGTLLEQMGKVQSAGEPAEGEPPK